MGRARPRRRRGHRALARVPHGPARPGGEGAVRRRARVDRHARRTCSPSRILAGTAAGRAGDALAGSRRGGPHRRGPRPPRRRRRRGRRGAGRRPRLVRHGRGARPRRRAAARRRRDRARRRRAAPSVGWHVAEGRQAMLDGLWSGLAYEEVLDALGIADEDRPELDAGALATAPGDAPALDLDFRALDRPPVRLPADVAPERVWRAAIDAVARDGRRPARAGRRGRRAAAPARRHRRLGARRGRARGQARLGAARDAARRRGRLPRRRAARGRRRGPLRERRRAARRSPPPPEGAA